MLSSKNNWDYFWSLDKTAKFTKESWSKKRIKTILAKYLFKDALILDAGCGSGFFSKYFSDTGLNVFSLDYSIEALRIAKEITEGKASVINEDLTAPDLPEKISSRFDFIFSDGLLEHFDYDKQNIILRNLIALLKKDGCLITFVPNKFSPWQIIRPFFMPGIKEKPFVYKELIELHQKNNLEVISGGGINTLPFRFSPDNSFGKYFGMLIYIIAKKNYE